MSMTMAATREPKKITGKKVLLWMVCFFGVIITVNIVFMYLALNTWPGLTTEDAYKKGLAYNQTLDAAARQSAMGWLSTVKADPGTGPDKTITINMSSKAKIALTGLVVTATVERALGAHETQIVSISESAPGVYSGIMKEPEQGRWLVEITAAGPNNASFRMKHQVMITP